MPGKSKENRTSHLKSSDNGVLSRRNQGGGSKQDIATADGAVIGAIGEAFGMVVGLVFAGQLTLRSLDDSRNHRVGGFLTTQRNPRWLVEVSTASACRAAGR